VPEGNNLGIWMNEGKEREKETNEDNRKKTKIKEGL
jgi:hypothetical protein